MLKRWTALILCISLVGMTMTPVPFLPCCCKKGGQTGQTTATRSCCEAGPGSVCGMHAVTPSSTHAAGCLKTMCKKCRCVEQMQAVALTAYVAQPNAARVAVVVPVTVDAHEWVNAPRAAADHRIRPQKDGPDLTLLNCSYRC